MSNLFQRYGIPFVSGAITSQFLSVGVGPLEMGALMVAATVAVDYFYADDIQTSGAGAMLWIPGTVYFGAALAAGGLNSSVNGLVGAIGTESLIAVLGAVFRVF